MVELKRKTIAPFITLNANTIFKHRYERFFLLALALSIFVHLLTVLTVPGIDSRTELPRETSLVLVELPPEVPIPPPPRMLPKPMVPDESAGTLFGREIAPPELTLPPSAPGPVTDFPEIEIAEVEEFLLMEDILPKYRYIPPMPDIPYYIAREKVNTLTLIVCELTPLGELDSGTSEIKVSSGYSELDELALEWASRIEFWPSVSHGEPTQVRVSIPVRWVSR